MGFERFGIVNYTKETKVADFVKYLDEGKVMGTQCTKCKTKYFPPRADCTVCLSSSFEWIEMTGKGKLITFVTVNYGPVGFEDKAPYTLGIVDFGGSLQALAPLGNDIKKGNVSIGMNLEIKPIPLPGGRLSYEFSAGK
jgi:uncharacterized OB-fold protein